MLPAHKTLATSADLETTQQSSQRSKTSKRNILKASYLLRHSPFFPRSAKVLQIYDYKGSQNIMSCSQNDAGSEKDVPRSSSK